MNQTKRIEDGASIPSVLPGKKAFVCDLDGTLFMGTRPIACAIRFVAEHAEDFAFYFF